MKSNIPQGWELLTLGDVVDKVTLKNKDSEFKDVLTNSASKGIINQKDYFDREITTESNISNYKIVENKDYVYNPRISSLAPAGPINQNNLGYTGIVSPLYTVFRIKEKFKNIESYLNFFFMSNEWNKYLFKVSNVGARHDRMNISDRDFFDMPILFPVNKEEQLKIISVLEKWDEMISALEEKVEKLDAFKKSLMDKLLTPKDDWIKKYLKDCVLSFKTGKLDANAMIANGNYRFYTCAKEYYYINEYAFDDEVLLISGNGANVGYIHYYKGKFNAYQRTYVLSNFEENIFFIRYYLEKNLKQRIDAEKADGNTPYIRLNALTDMTIYVPDIDKQKEIANTLSQVDDYIDLTKQQLDNYKEQKRTLMKKLLTGELRV